MTNTKPALSGIALLMCGLALAEQVPTLIRQAINEGSASGQVSGPIALKARLDLNATGPLSLTVKKVFDFDQPGCSRLQLDWNQMNALLPGAAMPTNYSWSSQMSICADGQPPVTSKRRN